MFIHLKLSIWCFIKFKYRFAEQFWIWPWGSLNTVPNCVAWPSLGQNLPPLSSELQREGSHVQTLSNNTKLWLFVRTIQCVPVTPVPMSSLAPSSLEHYLFMWTVSPLQVTDNPPSHSPPCTRSSDSLLCSWHFGISWPIAVCSSDVYRAEWVWGTYTPDKWMTKEFGKFSEFKGPVLSWVWRPLSLLYSLPTDVQRFPKRQHLGAHCRVSLWVSLLPGRGLRFESWVLSSPGVWPCVYSWFGL